MKFAPNQVFPGYDFLAIGAAAPAAGIFIPLSDLVGLTTDEANKNDGDVRKIIFEILKAIEMSAAYQELNSEELGMSTIRTVPVGLSTTIVRQTYQINFDLDITDADVKALPSSQVF